ncbi:serine-rich coiled-coil domain-containing protein 2 [Osmerus eperlanus]|uniref:serine-rich coiled-coil domain-containing protein 2 n=1 Tax=Osmerus eperlanus TaxID=29151 RepID=UPI002E10E4FF
MAEPLINAPVPTMPTMVSRLPKFGSRPAGGATTTATPLTNGFHHHPLSATGATATTGGKGLQIPPPLRQNGLARTVPSQSVKWRNGRGGGAIDKEAGQNDGDWAEPQQHHPRQRQPLQRSPMAPRGIKKPAGKTKGCGVSSAMTSSARTIPQSARTGPRSAGVAARQAQSGPSLCKGSKQSLNGRTSGQLRSGLLKLGLNPGSRFGSGSRSGSPNSNLPSSRSQSSESLKSSPSLCEDSMVRSQSLTQVRSGLPSPTLPQSPVTRSYSFSRATELPPQARSPTIRSPLARPAPALGGGGRGEGRGGGGNESFLLHPSKASPATGLTRPGTGAGSSSLIPPTALKKPLLSNPTSTKLSGSALSYRLTRPSLMSKPRPFLATTKVPGNQEVVEGRRNSLETPPETPDPSSSTESPGSTPEEERLSEEPEAHGEVPLLGETLEDMSLSSTSSLERNDNSEEYMDDFDNLGNGGEGILLLGSHDDGLDQSPPGEEDDNAGVSSAAGLHSFLSESVDWEGMGLTGCKRDFLMPSRRLSQVLSGGASLDLSPSDSSGGTYMWDEEGLEPLGSATSHPCGSYDSDLNSLVSRSDTRSCYLL